MYIRPFEAVKTLIQVREQAADKSGYYGARRNTEDHSIAFRLRREVILNMVRRGA